MIGLYHSSARIIENPERDIEERINTMVRLFLGRGYGLVRQDLAHGDRRFVLSTVKRKEGRVRLGLKNPRTPLSKLFIQACFERDLICAVIIDGQEVWMAMGEACAARGITLSSTFPIAVPLAWIAAYRQWLEDSGLTSTIVLPEDGILGADDKGQPIRESDIANLARVQPADDAPLGIHGPANYVGGDLQFEVDTLVDEVRRIRHQSAA